MSSKEKKYLIFILYSWLIYNSFIFIAAPFLISEYGFITVMGMTAFFIFPIYLFFIIAYFFLIIQVLIYYPSTLVFFPIVLINSSAIVFWCKKQTITRAWLLALAGTIVGPGLIYWFFTKNNSTTFSHSISSAQLWGILCLNAIYLAIFISNYMLKTYYPDNRFGKWIRDALKKPCFRT